MGFLIPVVPKSDAQLRAASRPTTKMVSRAPYFDTQAVTSGSTTFLNYFKANNTDITLTNQRGNGGVMPADTWFEPLAINIDFLAVNVLGGNTILGRLNDLDILFLQTRPVLTITIANTTLPQIPISLCHASGGPVGAVAGSWTAPQNAQFGNNGSQDGGYCVMDSFTIPPNTLFGVRIDFAAAPTLSGTTPFLRVMFDGNWYLPIAG